MQIVSKSVFCVRFFRHFFAVFKTLFRHFVDAGFISAGLTDEAEVSLALQIPAFAVEQSNSRRGWLPPTVEIRLGFSGPRREPRDGILH